MWYVSPLASIIQPSKSQDVFSAMATPSSCAAPSSVSREIVPGVWISFALAYSTAGESLLGYRCAPIGPTGGDD